MMYESRQNKRVTFAVLLLVCLTGCAFQEQDLGMPLRATWTPVVQSTDQPFKAKTQTMSYFGDTPALVIFGSQDPLDDTPLKVLNISTEDDYDVSSIIPAPADTWSRPVVAEDKDVYFQVGGTLYVLSPGGQTRSIELPYDEGDPAYCNWSWKGQLVCLNGSMTTGFLVDQDLNVAEMGLPVDAGNISEVYYEPYRVGENGMRTIQILTKMVNGRETVFYKDLDLETLTIESQKIRIEEDFNRTFYFWENTNELSRMDVTQEGGNVDVIGISETGDKVYLSSFVSARQYASTRSRWWAEVYDGLTLELLNLNIQVIHTIGKMLYQNYLITGWLFAPESGIIEQPTVYDLEAGEIVFSASGSLDNNEIINFILPYANGWVAGDSLAVHYYRNGGGLMVTFNFPEEITDSMGPDSYYTITQPIEP